MLSALILCSKPKCLILTNDTSTSSANSRSFLLTVCSPSARILKTACGRLASVPPTRSRQDALLSQRRHARHGHAKDLGARNLDLTLLITTSFRMTRRGQADQGSGPSLAAGIGSIGRAADPLDASTIRISGGPGHAVSSRTAIMPPSIAHACSAAFFMASGNGTGPGHREPASNRPPGRRARGPERTHNRIRAAPNRGVAPL